MRLCQQLGVTAVFAPPRETGFQAAIESYNARWQAKVWQRFTHPDLDALRRRSAAYVTACEKKNAALIARAKALRRPFPENFVFKPKAPLCDTVIFLRRTDETGRLVVMGRLYEIDKALAASARARRGRFHQKDYGFSRFAPSRTHLPATAKNPVLRTGGQANQRPPGASRRRHPRTQT